MAVTIRRIEGGSDRTIDELTEVLLATVEAGASVGFMLPLSRERARTFWQHVLEGVARRERCLLVADDADTGEVLGTVQLLLAMPDNQPHRADVAKMQVHPRARKRGVGAALLLAAEAAAQELGKTLLVLDTVTDSDAHRLYVRHGWTRVGEIPGYALWPQGGLCSTTVFYRDLSRANRGGSGSEA